jgi:hypothetical protein
MLPRLYWAIISDCIENTILEAPMSDFLILLAWVAILVVMYNVAKGHGRNPLLWVLLGLGGLVLGAVLFN